MSKRERALVNARQHIERALVALHASVVQERIRRLYWVLMRPLALFFILFGLVCLGLLYWLLGLSFSGGIALAGLTLLVPVLLFMWFGRGVPDFTLMLADVERSDECIAEAEVSDVLHWPLGHPSELREFEVKVEVLERWLRARLGQLEAEASWEEELDKEGRFLEEPSERKVEAPVVEERRPEGWIPPRLLAQKRDPRYHQNIFEEHEKDG